MSKNHLFKIAIFADHVIGYEVVKYLLTQNKKTCILQFVLTNRRSKIAWWPSLSQLLIKSGIPLLYYKDKETLYSHFNKYEIDYVFTFSWRHIIPENIIKIPKYGIINCHYGLLPKNRGMQPVNWTIINGDKVAGVSYHWVDSKIDHGDILLQKQVTVYSWDTTYNLLNRIDKTALKLFKKLWVNRIKLNIMHSKQISSNLYPLHLIKDYKRTNELNLDKKYTARELINLLRGKTFTVPLKKQVSVNSIYFIDPDTNKKIYISIKLSK